MNQRVGADQIAHIYGSGRVDGQERIQSGALLLRLLRYLTPFRLQLLGALVLVIITALVQAIGPALIARAIDVNITKRSSRSDQDDAAIARCLCSRSSVTVWSGVHDRLDW